MKFVVSLTLGFALLLEGNLWAAKPFNLGIVAVRDVVRIARAISLIQPHRSEQKYIEYGLAIYRASQRFGVEPGVLVAIAQQETSFRDDLPEGPAGELGICQVLKTWAKHPKFRAEFGNMTKRDFRQPAKSFLFAAWILRELRREGTRGALPYWSYYNARRFQNRFRYFLAVSKYLAVFKRNEHEFKDMSIAFLEDPAEKILGPKRVELASVSTQTPSKNLPATWRVKAAPKSSRQICSTRKVAALTPKKQTAKSLENLTSLNPFVANASVGGSLQNLLLGRAVQD